MIFCGSKKCSHNPFLSLNLKIIFRKMLRKKKMRQQQRHID